MPFVKGAKHSPEARAKMSASRKGKPHSAEHRAAIGAAHKGKKRVAKFPRICPCGVEFLATQAHAIYCSTPCKRAAKGHGLIHAPTFAHFPRVCAICGATEPLVGDHDHASGAPRGVLCRNCNVALSYMGDDPARLIAAARYLEASS